MVKETGLDLNRAHDILEMMEDISKYLGWMMPILKTGISQAGDSGWYGYKDGVRYRAQLTEVDINFLYRNMNLIYKMAKEMRKDFKQARRELR